MSTSRINHTGLTLAHKDNVDVIACTTCGYAHVMPLPAPEDLISFYRDSFYTTEKVDYLKSAEADRDWLTSTFNDRYTTFETLLPAERRQILDVGCGPGFFLTTGLARGWNVLGLEPSPQAAAFARGHGAEVIEDFFTADVAKSIAPQDVIHMSQVLEHVPNPQDFIRTATSVLLPQGLLCISVPNDFNPLQHALQTAHGHQPWWVSPTHHLNYFSFESLTLLLERHGFKVVHRQASFPLELFALMGDDYIADPELGPVIHQKRKALELTLEQTGQNTTKRALFEALANVGLGRLAIITARKLDA